MDAFTLRQVTYWGKETQEQLDSLHAAVVGVGGLGSAIAHLLVRMGVKQLTLYDGDTVATHNLSRQQLYTQEDVSRTKVEALKDALLKINPQCSIQTIPSYVTAASDLQPADVFFDGLDTHAIRRILDSYCQEQGLVWIHGAAIEEQGTVALFKGKEFSYDDMYRGHTQDTHCEQSGILMTTTTIIASLQVQLFLNYLRSNKVNHEFFRINLKNLSIERFEV